MEETSLKPMDSVEEITSVVQLENAKAKVENINISPSRVQKQKKFRLKSLWLPRLREERTTGRW